MKKILSLLLVVAMLFALAVPAFAEEAEEETPVAPYTVPADVEGKVVILHTNDVHGAVENYAKVATLKKMFEDAGAAVLLVDAGDFSQGETYVSVSEGKTAVEMMNLVGYEAAAPGNHEFDYGYENLKSLAELAQFPLLAANIKFEGKAAFGDHVVIEKGGKKIGVFGLDTPETATKAHPAKIKGVTFDGGEAMYAIAKAEVEALKAEKVDLIVCLSHLGIDEESAANGNRSIDMLAKVEGIDLLIDGHSHSTLEKMLEATGGTGKVGETVVTSTGTKIANVGVVIVDGKTITTENVSAEAIPVAEDDEVLTAAKAVVDAVNELYGQVFAKSEVALNGERDPGNRTEETNLGDLICDAMLWQVTKDGGLDVDNDHVIAITNGGIRAAIAAGDITRQDVNKVLPFGNTVATIYISGTALLEALEASTFCTPTAVGGFPQVAGINFTIDTAAVYDAGENYPNTTYAAPKSIARVTVNSVNGKPFDMDATYAVVTNDFVAAGGDTYYTFSTSKNIVDTGVPLDEALMAFITEELDGVVGAAYAAPQGRISVKYLGLEAGKWYTSAAKTVMDKGLMKSTGNGFDAAGIVTRGTIAQVLYNMEGKPEVNNKMATFPDAQGKWYEKAVRWAEEAGIAKGNGSGAFNGDANVSRAELVVFLHRYAEYKEKTGVANEVNLLDYADGEYLTRWTIPAFQWAVGNKLISGTDGNRLNPGGTATRAELAKILANSLDFFTPAAQ